MAKYPPYVDAYGKIPEIFKGLGVLRFPLNLLLIFYHQFLVLNLLVIEQ